jgi:hypothetical protein
VAYASRRHRSLSIAHIPVGHVARSGLEVVRILEGLVSLEGIVGLQGCQDSRGYSRGCRGQLRDRGVRLS